MFNKIFIRATVVIISLIMGSGQAWAVLPPPPPGNGSVGLEGTISSPPPKQGATITTPANGTTVTSVPISVNGLCTNDLLVKIFSNNVFIGSATCVHGSYSVQVDLFSGQNDIVARIYDALDQAGPDSNTVIVNFNDAQLIQFGSHVSITSAYAERGAPPGNTIEWPINLTNGTGPYAISVDWGDGSPTDLVSQDVAGGLTIKHAYKTAGTYKVIVKATDKNGGTAFLQLVGQATGAIQSNDKNSANSGSGLVQRELLWWPMLALVPLIIAAYWTGRRAELYTLRKQLEKSRSQ